MPHIPPEGLDLATASVGELIRSYRSAAPQPDGATSYVSQGDLAEWLGFSQAYLSFVESGHKRLPDIGTVRRIGQLLNLEPVDRDRLVERWHTESSSALERRLAKFGRSETEFLPGIPLDAVRTLFDKNATAKAALMAWLQQMPTRRGQGKRYAKSASVAAKSGAKKRR